MTIRIVRNEEANCINFEGSSVPAYFNACLSASAQGNLVHIKNDIRSALLGADFFEFSNIDYNEFQDKDGNSFVSAQEAADYITINGNVSAPADVNVGYQGVYNASTNTPDISSTTPENGDWYFVVGEGTQTLSSVPYDLKENDILKWDATNNLWGHIADKGARISEIESSALAEYDVYVDADYTGTVRTGTSVHPYVDLNQAIADAQDNSSILIKGNIIVPNSSTDAFTLPVGKSLTFYGAKGASVGYSSYDSTNGEVFRFQGVLPTKDLGFYNLSISNAGGYGIRTSHTNKVDVEDCVLTYNGWDGAQLNTILPSASSGLLGYDSSQAELQAFFAGTHASNGGAMRIQSSTHVSIISNDVSNNLRGIRIEDCGVNGSGVVTRNKTFNNIESGIYLASSSYDAVGGCENFLVYNNASKYNANNGILCIGGYNNTVALNHIEGNWNAGVMPWHVSNTTVRDNYVLTNNRSAFNGIGNTGDANASLEIAGDTLRSDAKFIAHILNNQLVDTGVGSSTTSNGLKLSSSLNAISDRTKAVILLDNNTMQGQDYAYLEECDLDKIRLIKGDNTYIDSYIQDTKTLGVGDYYELPYSNQHTNATALDFGLDATGSQVGIEDADGRIINYYGINQLKALEFLGNIRIKLLDSNKIQFDDVPPTGVSIDGVALTGTVAEKVNELNALFQNTGTSTGNIPIITSSLAISLVEGQTLNYELTDDYGTEYEWDTSAVSGVVVTSDNRRKIIGGAGLSAGTYNIPVKAINYNGEDSETIVLTVSTPPFSNTKSVQFNNQDYLGANSALLDNTLGRGGNGSGSSDAWTIGFWLKPTNSSTGRVLFYYGSNDTTNGGYIELRLTSSNKVRLQYGSTNNNVKILAPTALTVDTWQYVTVTYDGGTTGASSGDISDYYSRFSIYIDGVSQVTNNSNSNYGWSGAISGQNLRVGKLVSGNTLNGEKIDELAIWNSDQSANISTIYNSGSPFDLSTLGTQPEHWWRMGDGDSYPNLQDSGTEANCTFVMYNMTSADIVNDVP